MKEYKIRQVIDHNNNPVKVVEMSYFSPLPKKGGDTIILEKAPTPWLSTLKGLFGNCKVFMVLSVRDKDELIIKA